MTTKRAVTPSPWAYLALGKWFRVSNPDNVIAAEAYTEANAQLIASAPDLLAACKAVDAIWTEYQPFGPDDKTSFLHPDTTVIWRAIRAAIAKAESAS